jgi:hypothetical protein
VDVIYKHKDMDLVEISHVVKDLDARVDRIAPTSNKKLILKEDFSRIPMLFGSSSASF